MVKKGGLISILGTAFLMLVFGGIVYAQVFHIKVTYPTKGLVWNQGNTYTIHWDMIDASGKISKYYWVKIMLIPQGQAGQITLIGESAFHSDSVYLNWTVPSNILSGNYMIRVQERDTNKYGDSAPFTISPAPKQIQEGIRTPLGKPPIVAGQPIERRVDQTQQNQIKQTAPSTEIDERTLKPTLPERAPLDKLRPHLPDISVMDLRFDALGWGPIMAGTKPEEKWGKIRVRGTITNLGDNFDFQNFGGTIVLFSLSPQVSSGSFTGNPPANSIIKTQKFGKVLKGESIIFVDEPLQIFCANPRSIYLKIVYDPVLPINKSKYEIDKDWHNNEKVINAAELQQKFCSK